MTSAVPRYPGLTRAEREELRRRYGKPVKVIGAGPWLGPMLTQLGEQVDLDSPLVHVLAYRSVQAATVYAETNRRCFGIRVIGPLDTRDGPVNVLDITPVVEQQQAERAERERRER